jgi:hypothetical protein
MKKKKKRRQRKKQWMDALAVMAFVIEAIEFGIRLWELQKNKYNSN